MSSFCGLSCEMCSRRTLDAFSFGSTRSARKLTAAAHTPASRMVRGLGMGTENPAATVMPLDTKGHLMGLLSLLFRRFLTPWHVPMDIPWYTTHGFAR